MIGEVLVLDLLVVVYKIPYSSCIFNRAVVLEPGTMVCAYHTAVYLVHRSCLCHIYSWFLPMSWILDLSILLSICRAYIYIYIFGWLCRATYCSVVSTSMLGVSHAVQNEKKLWKFTQSDR